MVNVREITCSRSVFISVNKKNRHDVIEILLKWRLTPATQQNHHPKINYYELHIISFGFFKFKWHVPIWNLAFLENAMVQPIAHVLMALVDQLVT
jgi:hypothetical protein